MTAKGYGITTADMVSATRHSLKPITTVEAKVEADLHPCWLRRRHHGWFLCQSRTQSRAGDPRWPVVLLLFADALISA